MDNNGDCKVDKAEFVQGSLCSLHATHGLIWCTGFLHRLPEDDASFDEAIAQFHEAPPLITMPVLTNPVRWRDTC